MTLKGSLDVIKSFIDYRRLLGDNLLKGDNLEWVQMYAERYKTSGLFKTLNAFNNNGFWSGMGTAGKELGKGALALVKAHPVITALAGAMALDKFVFTMDDKLENAQEAIQNYQSTQHEIEGVNNELATTQSRMNELLAKDSLTLVEKDELSKLQRSNDELECRVKIHRSKSSTV